MTRVWKQAISGSQPHEPGTTIHTLTSIQEEPCYTHRTILNRSAHGLTRGLVLLSHFTENCARRHNKTAPQDSRNCPKTVLREGPFSMLAKRVDTSAAPSGKSYQRVTSARRFWHVGEPVWHVHGPVARCMSADKFGTSASLPWHVGRSVCNVGAAVCPLRRVRLVCRRGSMTIVPALISYLIRA